MKVKRRGEIKEKKVEVEGKQSHTIIVGGVLTETQDSVAQYHLRLADVPVQRAIAHLVGHVQALAAETARRRHAAAPQSQSW